MSLKINNPITNTVYETYKKPNGNTGIKVSNPRIVEIEKVIKKVIHKRLTRVNPINKYLIIALILESIICVIFLFLL